MTQYEMVSTHLEEHGFITPKQAEDEYGIMRLAAVIWNLRRDGMKIRTVMVNCKNRFGTPVNWAMYVKEGRENG